MNHRYHTEPRELWHLDVATGHVHRAALAWKWLAENVRNRWSNLAGSHERLLATGWSGETTFAFDDHRRKLFKTLEAAWEEADHLHTDLSSLADTATSYQRQLDDNYYRIARYEVAAESTEDNIVFRIPDEKHDEFVDLLEEARALRKGFDSVLQSTQFTADGVWEGLAKSWEGVASGATDPFILPGGALITSVLEVDGMTVINTGPGDDHVNLAIDPDTGHVLATVNGVVHDLGPAGSVIVRTGAGNDTLEIGPDVPVKLVLGGKGNDLVAGGAAMTWSWVGAEGTSSMPAPGATRCSRARVRTMPTPEPTPTRCSPAGMIARTWTPAGRARTPGPAALAGSTSTRKMSSIPRPPQSTPWYPIHRGNVTCRSSR
jgi:hypothetical protein